MKKIGVLVGSLRQASYNRKVAMLISDIAPPTLNLEFLEIGRMPFFNQDFEDNPPSEWTEFREKIKTLDAYIIATPEYNRSMPAVIKNALDVGSRPYGKNLWDGKPCAVISASPGAIGGFGANHHLRQCMVFLNSPCMQQPEVYLSHVDKMFDESGKINNEDIKKFLGKFIQSFEKWVKIHTN